jgi:biopolymer transport protein ExbD
MRFKRRVEIFRGQLELTPLVDVVLLLLIFFVLTSSLIFSPGLKVDLPESAMSTDVQTSDLVVTITEKNEVYFRGKLISPLEGYEELRDKLRDIKDKVAPGDETPRLIINADEKIPWGRVFHIMDIGWGEGFLTQFVGVRPKETP